MSAEKQTLRIELDAKRKRLRLEELFRQIFDLNAQVERNYAEIDKILGLNPSDKQLTTEHEITEAQTRNTAGRMTHASSSQNTPVAHSQTTTTETHKRPSATTNLQSMNAQNPDKWSAMIMEKNMTSEDEIARQQLLKRQADRKFHENALTNDLNTLDQLINQRTRKLQANNPAPASTGASAGIGAIPSQQPTRPLQGQDLLLRQRQNEDEGNNSSEDEEECLGISYRRSRVREDDEGNEIIMGLDDEE